MISGKGWEKRGKTKGHGGRKGVESDGKELPPTKPARYTRQ